MKISKLDNEDDCVKFTIISEQEIVAQAEKAEQEIKLGETLTHEEACQEFKKWF